MAKCSYGQVGNINPSQITKIKLKVMDYVFEYKGTDLTNAYLELSLIHISEPTRH